MIQVIEYGKSREMIRAWLCKEIRPFPEPNGRFLRLVDAVPYPAFSDDEPEEPRDVLSAGPNDVGLFWEVRPGE